MRNTQSEIEQTCREIERLTQCLAELVVEETGERAEQGLRVGDWVEVQKKDKCYGRRGSISGRRSREGPMWYVELEATKEAKGQQIWKMEKYLKRVEKEEQE